jgi:hypothetical protein
MLKTGEIDAIRNEKISKILNNIQLIKLFKEVHSK